MHHKNVHTVIVLIIMHTHVQRAGRLCLVRGKTQEHVYNTHGSDKRWWLPRTVTGACNKIMSK